MVARPAFLPVVVSIYKQLALKRLSQKVRVEDTTDASLQIKGHLGAALRRED